MHKKKKKQTGTSLIEVDNDAEWIKKKTRGTNYEKKGVKKYPKLKWPQCTCTCFVFVLSFNLCGC